MLKKGMTKQEIEEEIEDKGDFVKIDYLNRFLKEDIPIDMKKFVYLKLANVYENKTMFSDCAKMYDNIALISIAFSEKVKYHIKEAELYIKSGFFDKVNSAMRKAMNEANSIERDEIYYSIKFAYRKQAELYEQEMKRNHAVKIYEKLLEMNLNENERENIKKKLLELYEKLGKFREHSILKKGIKD